MRGSDPGQAIADDPLQVTHQIRIATGGNPNLLPEESKSYYAGFVLEDIAGVKNLSFNVDYFKFRINQVIVTPSATYLLSDRGRAQFPNAIVRESAGGPIIRIDSVPSNNPDAYQIYKGIDIGVNYRLNNTRYGDFRFSAEATRVLEIGSDSGLGGGYFDNVGLFNNMKWRGQAAVGWNYKDFAAGVTADYIGSYWNDGFSSTVQWREAAQTLVGASVGYRGFRGYQISVGASNLFDNLPPFNGFDTSSFDPNTYGAMAMGRFVYLRVRKDF